MSEEDVGQAMEAPNARLEGAARQQEALTADTQHANVAHEAAQQSSAAWVASLTQALAHIMQATAAAQAQWAAQPAQHPSQSTARSFDIRVLGKPPGLDGGVAGWPDWVVVFRGYMQAVLGL